MTLLHRSSQVRSILVRSLLVVLLALAAIGVQGGVSPAAAAEPGVETQLLSLTNAARARAGLPALQSSSTLVSVARTWSGSMAAKNALAHNPRLASQVSGWSLLGENVGMGGSAAQVQSLFMASSGHRANILNPKFNRVGIGVVKGSGGMLWFTIDFIQKAGVSSASTATASRSTASTASVARSTAGARAVSTRTTQAAAATRAVTHASRTAARAPVGAVRATARALPALRPGHVAPEPATMAPTLPPVQRAGIGVGSGPLGAAALPLLLVVLLTAPLALPLLGAATWGRLREQRAR